jgi:hypothetical protein
MGSATHNLKIKESYNLNRHGILSMRVPCRQTLSSKNEAILVDFSDKARSLARLTKSVTGLADRVLRQRKKNTELRNLRKNFNAPSLVLYSQFIFFVTYE